MGTKKTKAIHAYVTDDTHDAWHQGCSRHGVSVSAVIEELGDRIYDLLDDEPDLLRDAKQVDAYRRRRRYQTERN